MRIWQPLLRASGLMVVLSLMTSREAMADDLTFSPSPIAFGDVIVGVEKRVTFTILNGGGAHTINSIGTTPSQVKVCLPGADPCVPPGTWPPVAAGGSLAVDVAFRPTTLGALSGGGLQVDSDEGAPAPTPVTGTGKEFDLVVLVDDSGSMGTKPDGTWTSDVSQTRLYEAKQGIIELTHILDVAFPSSGTVPIGVKAGVCLFNGGCPAALATFNKSNLDTRVNAIAAVNSTPMGKGLKGALAQLAVSPADAPFHNRAIIMLSDGAHNLYPCPSSDATYPCPDAGNLTGREGIRLFGVGYGTAGVDFNPVQLRDLVVTVFGNTVADGLRHYIPSTVPLCPSLPPGVQCVQGALKGLDAFFVGFLQAMGLTQAAVDPVAMVQPGQTLEHPVDITELDAAADFGLSWRTGPSRALTFVLVTPDGQIIDPKVARADPDLALTVGPSSIAYTARKGYLHRAGKVGRWKLRVTLGGGTTSGGVPSDARASAALMVVGPAVPFTYNYSVYVPSALELAVRFDKPAYNTGDQMLITATVTAKGALVRGAQIAAIEARFERPGESMGNWYAAHDPSAPQLAATLAQQGTDPVAPVQRKGLALRAAGVADPYRTVQPGLVFKDDGSGGDAQAGDGIYTARYADTSMPDTHTFYLRASGTTPAGTPFTREALLQQMVTVAVAPDPVTSPLTYQLVGVADRNTSRVQVKVIPKDRFGNHLGPGYASAIDFTTTSGTWVGPLTDDLSGGYTRLLEFQPGAQNPSVTVTVQGQSFPPDDVKGRIHPRFSLEAFAGGFFISNIIGIADGPVFGVRAGVSLVPSLTLEAEVGGTPTHDAFGVRGKVIQTLASLRWDLDRLTLAGFTPFVTAGGGMLRFSGFTTDDTSGLVQFGGGLLSQISPIVWLRLDAREMLGTDTYGLTTNNFQATIDVALRL